MLPADHPTLVTANKLQDEFTADASDKDAFIVNIVWGVKGLNRDDVSMWDPESLGELVWDKDFTMEPAAN